MKRRRLIMAGLVAMAAAVCVASWWDRMWRSVAYDEGEVYGVRYYVPRGWFPGDVVCPPQRCRKCGDGLHEACADGVLIGSGYDNREGSFSNRPPPDWELEVHCTCSCEKHVDMLETSGGPIPMRTVVDVLLEDE